VLSATLTAPIEQCANIKLYRSGLVGKAVWLSLHKIKREATPHTKPTQVASHFILPNRTRSSWTVSALI